MAGVFYTRYIPGVKNVSTPTKASGDTQNQKRDLDASVSPADPPPSKKQKKSQVAKTFKEKKGGKREQSPADRPTLSAQSPVEKPKRRKSKHQLSPKTGTSSKNAIDEEQPKRRQGKEAHEQAAREVTASLEQSEDIKGHSEHFNRTEQQNEGSSTKKSVQEVDHRTVLEGSRAPLEAEEQPAVRHSRIMDRYLKSLSRSKDGASTAKASSSKSTPTVSLQEAELVVTHGLDPLPQPGPVPDTRGKPVYASEPPWLINPARTSSNHRAKFSELGVSGDLLETLDRSGYTEAFAVQASVIPLLLPTPNSHPGDLCISAATGSGKTLSYILPLVSALRSYSGTRLRALIVVPTRELVRQAREVCELCAAGSGLRIGSAVGNVSLKEEQRTLIRADPVYKPEEVKMESRRKMSADDWCHFNLQDYIVEAVAGEDLLPGYVNEFSPGVDILICTPGRLVDHIRFTKGFSLRHIEWLVVDEADRLLNESFQEWVEVVMNSLDERKQPETASSHDKLFAGLRLPVENPDPKKIILSATMTRDLSKLNSLRLSNPKLVVVGTEVVSDNNNNGNEMEIVPMSVDSNFTLPSTLKEFNISVGEGSDKPLFLLHLLLHHIRVNTEASHKPERKFPNTTNSPLNSQYDSDSDDSTSVGSDDSSESDLSLLPAGYESSGNDSDSRSEYGTPPKQFKCPTALIFAKSSEAAVRLSRLLSLLHPPLAGLTGTIVKSNSSSASRKTLSAYRRGKISIIIATDRASRGLDLPSLAHVINYDIPTSVTSYIHRVGRTARAGQGGSAWTLVAHREGRWFSGEIAKRSDGKIIRTGHVEKVNIKAADVKASQTQYEDALDALEIEVRIGAQSARRAER